MNKAFLYTLFSLITLVAYWFISFLDLEKWGMTTEILYIIAPASAFLAGIFLLRNIGTKNSLGFPLLFLVLGMLCFVIGETIWFYLDYVMGIDPYPSIADFFLLVVFPITLIGLVLKIKSEKIKWSISFFKKNVALIFPLLISTAVVLYFGVYSAYAPDDSFASNIVSMLYGVGDLILIFASFLVLIISIEYRGGKMFSPWMLVTLSYSVLLIADVLFSANRDAYETNLVVGVMIDCIWMAGYFVFGLGMIKFLEIVQGQQLKIVNKINIKKNEE